MLRLTTLTALAGALLLGPAPARAAREAASALPEMSGAAL